MGQRFWQQAWRGGHFGNTNGSSTFAPSNGNHGWKHFGKHFGNPHGRHSGNHFDQTKCKPGGEQRGNQGSFKNVVNSNIKHGPFNLKNSMF
jgi:hypothetical protein